MVEKLTLWDFSKLDIILRRIFHRKLHFPVFINHSEFFFEISLFGSKHRGAQDGRGSTQQRCGKWKPIDQVTYWIFLFRRFCFTLNIIRTFGVNISFYFGFSSRWTNTNNFSFHKSPMHFHFPLSPWFLSHLTSPLKRSSHQQNI